MLKVRGTFCKQAYAAPPAACRNGGFAVSVCVPSDKIISKVCEVYGGAFLTGCLKMTVDEDSVVLPKLDYSSGHDFQ